MKILRNISDRKSVINCLLLAVLSAGIFLLHETGPGMSSMPREATHVTMPFQGSRLNVTSIHEIYSTAKDFEQSRNSSFLILKTLSDSLTNLASVISANRLQLPVLRVNPTQHFRSRSLTPEDSFHAFS